MGLYFLFSDVCILILFSTGSLMPPLMHPILSDSSREDFLQNMSRAELVTLIQSQDKSIRDLKQTLQHEQVLHRNTRRRLGRMIAKRAGNDDDKSDEDEEANLSVAHDYWQHCSPEVGIAIGLRQNASHTSAKTFCLLTRSDISRNTVL